MKSINKATLTNILMIGLIVIIIILGYVLVDNKKTNATGVNSQIVATSSFGNITKTDLIKSGGVSLQEVYQRVIKQEKEVIDDILIQKEAEKNNMQKVDFLNKYVGNRGTVSSLDIDKEYEKIIKKYPNVTKEQVKNKLNSDQFLYYKQLLVKDLKRKYDLKLSLNDLTKVTVQKNKFHDISFGAKNAAIQVAVFSDYQCSHCKTFHEELEKRMQQYPNHIRVQYHHFPIINAFSKNLAIYGYCMNDQGRYKEYSEFVYNNQGKLNYNNLTTNLATISHDNIKLTSCLKSSMPTLALDKDIEQATSLNVNSTPKVIVNGYVSTLMDLDAELKKINR